MPTKDRLLELALIGLEAERTKIDQEISQIKSQLRGMPARSAAVGNEEAAAMPRKRRKMSAAARKKISEAMKRRYAQKKAAAKS